MYYGKFQQLKPGTVQPTGFLKDWLNQQNKGLSSHYTEQGFPFDTPMWNGGVGKIVPASIVYNDQAAEVAIAGMYNQADGDLDLLARLIAERVSFEINRAAKVGVWRNGQLDRRNVRFARVPTGAETCAWCLMTAGLGFWYMTEEAASHTHRSCDCMIVPSFEGIGDVHIDGYDSTVYRDMWRDANAALRNGDVPTELAQRVDFLSMTKPGYRADTNGALAVMRWKYGLK